MIDKYRLEDLRRESGEKGELARWVIQLQKDLDDERRKAAVRPPDVDERLAAHEQEPVAYDQNQRDLMNSIVAKAMKNNLERGDKLVMADVFAATMALMQSGFRTHPAPSIPAAVPEVDADDNFYSWFGREWYENYQQNQYTAAAKQMLGVMAESAWKASRRAAMLQSEPNGWIPVSERYPDVGDIVLTAIDGCTNVGEMERSAANYRYFTSVVSGRELPATHWQPLPAAPKV